MEDIKQTWNQTTRQLFEEFKFVLNNVGVGISANEYDRLQAPEDQIGAPSNAIRVFRGIS